MSKQQAADIRAALAKAGFGRAEVSVRNDSYSMGSTVRIRIKRAMVPLERVEAIARQFERVSRCEYSGEILSGGNQFVDVGYESGALGEYAAKAAAEIARGRDYFGPFHVSEQDRFTLGVWLMQEETLSENEAGGGRVGSWVGQLDRNYPGEGLARLLARGGQLALLDEPWPEPVRAVFEVAEPESRCLCSDADAYLCLDCERSSDQVVS